jgi:mono/diheme cytochrome c family protein
MSALLVLAAAPAGAQDHPGKATYDKWCSGCHGVDGAGAGDAAGYMLPRPRDFTKALYQVRTTGSGQLPTDADILKIIDEGMPGTAMPGWRSQLSQQQRSDLVAYLKTFSRFFETTPAPAVLTLGRAPRASDEMIERGREFYQSIECFKCHGQTGRGDGPSAPTQTDDAGFPIRPADLTQPWLFNGGGTVEDIHRALRTGFDGTPMPSFSDLIASDFMTEDDLWAVAHYVRSLAPEQFPDVQEVLRAPRLEAGLPGAVDDAAWDAIDPVYVPLVGQIIVSPRWFNPSVTGVWLQAAHDDNELVMRLSWTDRSLSPDPAWTDWRALVTSTMEPKEGVVAAPADVAAAGPAAPESAGVPPLPDVMIVQFPRAIPEGMERPYFLLGNARDPVYLWRWQSQPDGVTEMLGRGLGSQEALPAGNVTSQAAHADGQWRVVLRRPLADPDSANRITFAAGQPIPIGLFAWDGDNGEEGTRGAIGTWYFLYLEQPASGMVYATPVLAVLLTAGLGLLAVGRAQKKQRGGTIPGA